MPTQNLPNPFQAVFNGITQLFGGGGGETSQSVNGGTSGTSREREEDQSTGVLPSTDVTQHIPGDFPALPSSSSTNMNANTAPSDPSSAPPPVPANPPRVSLPRVPGISSPLGFTPPSSSSSPSIFADRTTSPSYFNGTARPLGTPSHTPTPDRESTTAVQSGVASPAIPPYPNAIPQEHRQRFAQREEAMRRQREQDGPASGTRQNEP